MKYCLSAKNIGFVEVHCCKILSYF